MAVQLLPAFHDNRYLISKILFARDYHKSITVLEIAAFSSVAIAGALCAAQIAAFAVATKVAYVAILAVLAESSYKGWLAESSLKDRLILWYHEDHLTPVGQKRQAAERVWSAYIHRERKLALDNLSLHSIPSALNELVALEKIDLRNNLLTQIPRWLADLSDCRIRMENNRLPHSEVTAFQQILNERLDQHQKIPRFTATFYQSPRFFDQHLSRFMLLQAFIHVDDQEMPDEPGPMVVVPLSDRLDFWHGLSGSKDKAQFLKSCQTLVNHDAASSLSVFLGKVTEIEDFNKTASQKKIVATVMTLLQAAAVNEEFRDKLFVLAAEATSDCEDRVTLFLNKMEIYRRICCDMKKASLLDVCKFSLGYKRLALLDGIAKAKAKERGFDDVVEVLVYFQKRLRSTLALPITTDDMMYSGAAERSDINRRGFSDLEMKAVNQDILCQTTSHKQICSLLCDPWPPSDEWIDMSTIWAERFKAQNPEQFEAIDVEISDKIDALDPNMDSKRYKAIVDKYQEERRQRHQALLEKLTWSFVVSSGIV